MAKKPIVVDFHAHILEPHVLKASAGRTVVTGFGAIAEPPRTPGSRRDIWFKQMMDPEAHLEGLAKMGVDVSVISSSTVIQNTAWADASTGLELDRRCNDMIADWVRRYPDRFVGTFTMPLKDPHLSLQEMERAVKQLGLRIANLPANVEGVYLGEPRFRPFWEAVNELGVIAFIHPDGVLDPWFQKYSLWNSVGQPIEEAKVMSSLIYEGVLESFPDLKIVMAHGGGYMPHYHGRLDRNVKNRPDTMANIKPRAELVPEAVLLRHLHLRSGDARCADRTGRRRPHSDGFGLPGRRSRSGRLSEALQERRRPCLRADFRRDRLLDPGDCQRAMTAVTPAGCRRP